jgi:pimeloyl-ACP methyl ester carboxylesterase
MAVPDLLLYPNTPMRNLLQKYTNQHSRFMVINGQLVHYRDEGEGEVLLCLHGAFSSLHTFNNWAKLLSGQYRIVRFDLAGFGLTGPNHNNDYSIQNHLNYVEEILDFLKIDKCHIIGSSLGGWVAWEYALAHPERIHKMVLIDSAGFLEADSIPAPFIMARMPLVDKVINIVLQRETVEVFLRQVYHNQDKVTERLIDRYYDLFTREGNQNAFVRLVNQRFKDNTRKLRYLDVPTLILWGEQDRWLSVKCADRFLKLIPGSEGIIYESVGHVPMEEIPRQTAADVVDFLQRP